MVRLRFLLDTNVLSEPVRKRPDEAVLRNIERHQDDVATCSVIWHELVFGCERLPAGSEKRSVLERYLAEISASSLPILPYDTSAASWHGKERARLTAMGLTPAFADGQIASIAMTSDLTLITNNVQNFQHFEGLRIERWHRPEQ